jgi:hypothetical protein
MSTWAVRVNSGIVAFASSIRRAIVLCVLVGLRLCTSTSPVSRLACRWWRAQQSELGAASARSTPQVELGNASPSVVTLYAIVNEFGLSLDELFFQTRGPWPPNNGETESRRLTV